VDTSVVDPLDDVTTTACGGRLKIVAAVLDPDEIALHLHGARGPRGVHCIAVVRGRVSIRRVRPRDSPRRAIFVALSPSTCRPTRGSVTRHGKIGGRSVGGTDLSRLLTETEVGPNVNCMPAERRASELGVYRDWLMVDGRYNPRQPLPLIPRSMMVGDRAAAYSHRDLPRECPR
jgi:hypothetical protein